MEATRGLAGKVGRSDGSGSRGGRSCSCYEESGHVRRPGPRCRTEVHERANFEFHLPRKAKKQKKKDVTLYTELFSIYMRCVLLGHSARWRHDVVPCDG